MHKVIYERLTTIARSGSTTTYGAIAPMANLNMGNTSDRAKIGRILEEISKTEDKAGRPMLSAVVVRAGDGYPGSGFFDLAKRLGKYQGGDDLQFYVEELARVHSYWREI